MQKKKSSKQEDIIQDFFKKNKISGLFYIPDKGTFSFFSSDMERLLVLEHAKVELIIRERMIEAEAMQMLKKIDSTKNIEEKKDRTYLG